MHARSDKPRSNTVEDTATPEHEHEALLAMLGCLPLGVCLISERHERVLRFNDAFCRMWQLESLEPQLHAGTVSVAELYVHACRLAADPEEFQRSVMDLVDPGSTELVDREIRLRDGRVIRRLSVRLRDSQRDDVRRLCLYEDVTARLQAEEERRTLERRMQEVQRLDSLGVLAGGIAHDFNNLLTSIIGNAELASLAPNADAAVRQQMSRVLEAASKAADLCQRMLTYAGASSAFVRRVHLTDLVHHALRWIQPQFPARVRIEEVFAEQLPAVLADPTQLSQVVVNLVANACEALGDGGGTVRVSTGVAQRGHDFFAGAVLAPPLPAGEYVHVSVCDDGCGLDAATKARMFEPFFSTKFVGRGLGLASSLGIVRSHHGAIRVESEPGRGTQVCVVLPVARRA